ncbi:hypothetical protein GQ43DRAFT_433565 [Delitschia confertaspora ATCC 74209]|uniref:Uncharacterized protein n=1 Tax=Delitschia confertaspora ATCC 74209 TaxID=1513339 RepID=A0A9P4JJG6_9PLEO|nr:hypothetical protein GQ43DRAFT_433565 [Delitschia confertaspora ATCC 74209]
MSSPTRQNRFQSFTPLYRLRTAFSPNRTSRSISPSSIASTATTSPLTRTSSPDYHFSSAGHHISISSGHNFSNTSSPDSYRSRSSTRSSIRQLLMLRRKPSVLDLEMEEERLIFSHELEMLEPRPVGQGFGGRQGMGGRVELGIFEVLDGRV